MARRQRHRGTGVLQLSIITHLGPRRLLQRPDVLNYLLPLYLHTSRYFALALAALLSFSNTLFRLFADRTHSRTRQASAPQTEHREQILGSIQEQAFGETRIDSRLRILVTAATATAALPAFTLVG